MNSSIAVVSVPLQRIIVSLHAVVVRFFQVSERFSLTQDRTLPDVAL